MSLLPPPGRRKPPDDETADAIAVAKSGTDQMQAVYMDIWIPFFSSLGKEMDKKGMSAELRDRVIGDLHHKFITMSEVR